MTAANYKKMAGTSAVFLVDGHSKATPVERDGLTWTAAELHLQKLPSQRQGKPAMANVLALEGLEEYDVPENGDVRFVESIGESFVYFERIHGWIQTTSEEEAVSA